VGILGAATGAGAGECVVNANPVPPSDLAFALESEGSFPGQLSGVPFSVAYVETLNINWVGCAQDCIFSQGLGETQCGNLVDTPIDEYFARSIAGVPDPPAITEVRADQATSGKWDVAATAFISPTWEEDDGSAAFGFQVGTRDVIDVSGGSGMVPLEIGLRAASHLAIQFCAAGLFTWIPQHTLRFRVTEQLLGGVPFERALVNEVYSQFFRRSLVFPVEVRPGATLTVDVWFQASANATGANDIFGNQCRGGYALLDLSDQPPIGGYPGDGIEVFFTPDPSLTLTPRSGFTYQGVPEPGARSAGSVRSRRWLSARDAGARRSRRRGGRRPPRRRARARRAAPRRASRAGRRAAPRRPRSGCRGRARRGCSARPRPSPRAARRAALDARRRSSCRADRARGRAGSRRAAARAAGGGRSRRRSRRSRHPRGARG
jgi:hypothetical protein